MSKVTDQGAKTPIKNENLKDLKPFTNKKGETFVPKHSAAVAPKDTTDISKNAKALNQQEPPTTETPSSSETNSHTAETAAKASSSATDVAKAIAKVPVLPITVPKTESKIEKKLADLPKERTHYIKKPAVIFIEGFSAFGISNGDGIKDMADNFPGAQRFDWTDKDKIIDEIKKHALDQPVVLVGHSFGGDTAVEIANELNSAKNSFRDINLLITLDSVGFNNSIIPMNVKRNLNFFQEGTIPFLHGNANVARNTDYTEIINELRNELHSRIDDSPEVQYKIFENINETVNESEDQSPTLIVELDLADLIGNQLSFEKKPEH